VQVGTPLVGGVLAESLGWRSTFAALAIMCGIAAMTLLVCMRRETHQYFVLQRLAQMDLNAAHAMQEWDAVMAAPPKFDAPWIPIM
jgi:predicted MFS family arabinose efflux permease